MTAPERIMVSACGKAIVTGQKAFPDDVEYIRADLLDAAEARITELEAAMRKIADSEEYDEFNGAYVPTEEAFIARAALGEKKDG